jgi:hypothetical protein
MRAHRSPLPLAAISVNGNSKTYFCGESEFISNSAVGNDDDSFLSGGALSASGSAETYFCG